MFQSAESRYGLRIGVVSGLALLATLKASIGDGVTAEEWVNMAYMTVVAGATYAGLGAFLPQVEPFVGRKLKPPPEPPSGDA